MVDIADLFKQLATAPAVERKPDKIEGGLAGTFRSLAMAYVEASNDTSGGYKNYLRASGLHAVCGRREAIMLDDPPLRRPERRSAGGVLTADIGHQAHAWWQNRYLGPAGLLLGRWVCLRCSPVNDAGWLEPVHEGLMPEGCPNCDSPRRIKDQQVILFSEMFVKDDKLRYSGHPDGLLVLPEYAPRLLFELKTIKTDAYDKLKRPKADHEVQVHAYMRLLDVTDALVVYADKGRQCPWKIMHGQFVSGEARVKVFHVAYNPGFWAGIEERILDYWRAVDGTSPRKLPRLCSKPTSGDARLCTAVMPCFSLLEDGRS